MFSHRQHLNFSFNLLPSLCIGMDHGIVTFNPGDRTSKVNVANGFYTLKIKDSSLPNGVSLAYPNLTTIYDF